MKITKENIKKEFCSAESNLEFCWEVLTDLKEYSINDKNFVDRFIFFQEKLATTIFKLQSIRDLIIIEEKYIVKNKVNYNNNWFISKLRLLSKFKDGIDSIVNISKALGDAYAYFFYQRDLELLSKHFNHQKVINHTSGVGERGELEFIKQIKHIKGEITIFHGITNVLRYGDFSFIDLKSLRVTKIGELKTKKIDNNTLNLRLYILDRYKLESKKLTIKNQDLEKTRKGRQLVGIANFLIPENNTYNSSVRMENPYYSKEIETLIKKAKINKGNCTQVSAGLAFVCIKLKKTKLYRKVLYRKVNKENLTENISETIIETVKNLAKDPKKHNSIIIDQLLYNKDLSDKSIPGTIPLFWHHIDNNLLKQLYFTDCLVVSLFNPIYLIEEVEKMGFTVSSKYANRKEVDNKKSKKEVQQFDYFIPYIVNFLFNESFVINSLKEIESSKANNHKNQFYIKPQQFINFKND